MDSVVLVASPNETVRRRWRRWLEERFVIHEVAQRLALVRSLAAVKPAVLLLDLRLPRLGGVSSVPALQRLSPLTAIVLLTDEPDEKEGVTALKAGARGYGSREIAPSLLKKAVDRVQMGEFWAGRKIVSSLLDELSAVTARRQSRFPVKPGGRFEGLSARQREIALLVGGGATNKEIAGRLHITERAVKAHLTVIFRKLGITNRLQLALSVVKYIRPPQ